MRCVELFGLPGAGKSTALQFVLERDGEIKRAIDFGNGARALSALERESGEWSVFIRVVRRGLSSTSLAPIDYSSHVWKSLRKIAAVRRTDGDGVALIDGGLCQRGLTLVLCCASEEEVANYYRAMPAPDAVLLFSADYPTLIARNKSRSVEKDFSDRVESMGPTVDVARNILSERGIPIIAVDTTEMSPSEAADAVISGLRQ